MDKLKQFKKTPKHVLKHYEEEVSSFISKMQNSSSSIIGQNIQLSVQIIKLYFRCLVPPHSQIPESCWIDCDQPNIPRSALSLILPTSNTLRILHPYSC